MDIDTAFEILGFSDKYTVKSLDTVKKQYIKLALKVHPDKNRDNPNAKVEFQELSNAYGIIQENPPPYNRPAAAPSYEYAAPSYEYAAPSYEYAAPRYEYAAPRYEYAAPRYEYAAPRYEYAAPSYEYAAPSYEYAAPRYEYAAPRYEYAAPRYEYAAPRNTTSNFTQRPRPAPGDTNNKRGQSVPLGKRLPLGTAMDKRFPDDQNIRPFKPFYGVKKNPFDVVNKKAHGLKPKSSRKKNIKKRKQTKKRKVKK